MRACRIPLLLTAFMLAACTAGPTASLTSLPQTASPSSAPDLSEAVIATIPLDLAGETTVAVGEGAVWLRLHDGSVARIDPATNTVVATIAVGRGQYGQVAVGEAGVWVTTFAENRLSRIDPETNRVVAEITVGDNPEGIAFTPGAVWVSNHRAGSVSRIDPATNAVVATITFGPEGSSGPRSIAIAAGDLWTPVPNMSSVVRISPESNEVLETLPFNDPHGVISDGDKVYVSGGGQVSEIDPGTNSVIRELDLEHEPAAVGLASFWTAVGQDLLRLDPETLQPVASWRVLERPALFARIAFGEGSIWLAPLDQPILVRVDPGKLTISSPQPSLLRLLDR
jgi:YVTN family beta-propeller protein